ncbi:MAG: DNA-3-methyladenine glycosylase [Reyranellaceae bacterium]
MARIRRLNQRSLKEGAAHLAKIDPDLARALEQCGLPALRSAEPGFATLLRSIVGQQVSVHAARAIWEKLALLVDPLTPENLLAAGEPVLRQAGFSGQKIRYGLALAADVVERRLDLEALHVLDDEAAIAELVKAKGIGRWTAEIYLMFALGRHDIMPGADVGLWVALQHLKRLRQRPDAARLIKVAEAWRPWRSVAALTLWHYRRNMPDWAKTEARLALRVATPVPTPDPISPPLRRRRTAA